MKYLSFSKKSLFKRFISKNSLFKNQVINCLITKSSPNDSKKTFTNAKKTTVIKGFAKVFLLKKPLFIVLINAVNFPISLRWIFTAKIFFTAMNSLLVSQCTDNVYKILIRVPNTGALVPNCRFWVILLELQYRRNLHHLKLKASVKRSQRWRFSKSCCWQLCLFTNFDNNKANITLNKMIKI